MRSSIITAAVLSTALFTACNGGGNSGSQTQVSALVQLVDSTPAPAISQASTSENVALTVWGKLFNGKPSAKAKFIGNVAIIDEEVQTIEYDDGGMVNSFQYNRIACFPLTNNSWRVIEYRGSMLSDSGETETSIKSYTYSDGTLTPTQSKFLPNLASFLSEDMQLRWDEDEKAYLGYDTEFDFGTDYATVIYKGNAVALNWNGADFTPAKPTEKQYLSEETLFKKVIAVFPYLKDKEVNISFGTDYCEWGDFFIDGDRFTYGRYKKNDGSYLIYVSCTPKEAKQIIYKYSYDYSNLKLISENAFLDEIAASTVLNDGKEHQTYVRFESNPYKCSAFVLIDEDYDNARHFEWNGESFK